jgi:hypothetical protein
MGIVAFWGLRIGQADLVTTSFSYNAVVSF